jgi:phosphoglycerate kinase
MKLLKDLPCSGKRVIVRVDFNVPMDGATITSDARIAAAIPTIKHLLGVSAQVILMSHLGRPDGKPDLQYSLKPISIRLGELLSMPVFFAPDCIGAIPPPEQAKLVLLENLRFYPEEEKNDDGFAKKLAEHADYYVNDAFGTMHRAHASTAAIAKYLPGGLGLLAEKELNFLDLSKLPRPVVAIIGGSKISTKFGLFQTLLTKVDFVCVGGAMIFTFFKADGLEIGKSLVELDYVEKAKLMLHNEKLLLPQDVVVANDMKNPTEWETVFTEQIPADRIGLDLGEDTVSYFKQYVDKAKSVVWNGPLGYFEKAPFDQATNEIARYLARRTKQGLVTVLGGGDTESAVSKLGLDSAFTHLSTGGGASLELLSGKELPAVKALKENEIEFFT